MVFISLSQGLRLILFGAALLAIMLASVACGKSGNTQTTRTTRTETTTGAAEAADAPAIAVTTVRVEVREVPSFIQASGSLLANESSDVASQASGQVVATPVNIGAFVRQGAILARLNDRDARLRLRQSQAAVQQAQAGVRQAEARLGLGPNGRFDASTIPEVRSAAAAYDAALAQQRLAEANAKRYAELVETGDVARSVYDQYRTQADTARAQASNARQQLEIAINQARQNNQAIQTAQAAVVSAQAQVAINQKAVDDSVIRAPYSGYISARPIAVGEYVTPASVIATILLTNPLKLEMQVPEMQAPNLHQGRGGSAESRQCAARRHVCHGTHHARGREPEHLRAARSSRQ
ncbi:MAG: HlyD family efflux transporter periplasmic adaptor subunit [Acidobacteria bacterium]|nr:HlyD family efflux transporter periplasmic adaptor subunit [Acidobacteriota bacterium]